MAPDNHLAVDEFAGRGRHASRKEAVEDARRMQASILKDQTITTNKAALSYALQELIGKGSYGRVYRATNTKSGQLVAIKMVNIEELDGIKPGAADTFTDIYKEVNTLKHVGELGTKNINSVIDAFLVGHSMWIITEYCAGGSVATLMKPTGSLAEKWVIPILREVAKAIQSIHAHGIIHRDIKCANVLITQEGGVQLCDFGVAAMIQTKFDKRSTMIGTLHWMAPELFKPTVSYGPKVDIWAFGAMAYEIVSGMPPNAMESYHANVDITGFGDFLHKHIPRLEGPRYSNGLKDLVAFCLEESPEKRPAIEHVLRHPYLHNSSFRYPTSSLSALVGAYKIWEEQGGSRKSLFNPMLGAPAPADIAPTTTEEWNFSTTVEFDKKVHDFYDQNNADALRDVYEPQADFPSTDEATARPKPRGRRRPPPKVLAAMKAPLEKVFDPNTMSNYAEHSQSYYGRSSVPQTPTSSLPPRDDSRHGAERESLIDLDASLDASQGVTEMSGFPEENTIKPRGSRSSMNNEWSFASATAAPSDQAPPSGKGPENRKDALPQWKWPTVIDHDSETPPSPETQIMEPGLSGSPQSLHHLRPPQRKTDRVSVGSLIDLDAGLVDADPTEDSRPSTSHSDAASMSGFDMGGCTSPFGLEKHTSLNAPLPLTNREPSIYVSDTFDFPFKAANAKDHKEVKDSDSVVSDTATQEETSSTSGTITLEKMKRTRALNHQVHYDEDGEKMKRTRALNHQVHYDKDDDNNVSFEGGPGVGSTPLQFPHVAPPSMSVMEGTASREEVKDDLQRLVGSLMEHLSIMGSQVGNMEPRRAGGGSSKPSGGSGSKPSGGSGSKPSGGSSSKSPGRRSDDNDAWM